MEIHTYLDGLSELPSEGLGVGNVVVRDEDGGGGDVLGHDVVQVRPGVLLAGGAAARGVDGPATTIREGISQRYGLPSVQ